MCRDISVKTLSEKMCGTLKSPPKIQLKLAYFNLSCFMISCMPSNKTFVSYSCTSDITGLWWAGFAVKWTAPIMTAWGGPFWRFPVHAKITKRTVFRFVLYLSLCSSLKLLSNKERHGVSLVVVSSKSVAMLSSNLALRQKTATPMPASIPV